MTHIRPLKMLIVDDLEKWRYAIKIQFDGRNDINITESSGPSDAIEKIQKDNYDIVLLDMKMPSRTEGITVLKKIKELKPSTDVIMMSAYADIVHVVEAMKLGALDFIPRLPDFEEVIKFKINEFIRKSHLMADREVLIQSKLKEAKRAKSVQKKGKALEDLLSALFSTIEGFLEAARNVNTTTEEIDLVYRNESNHIFWQKQGDYFLVECKNWYSQKVGKNEFVSFKEKMENRYGRCKLGFFVISGSFASTFADEMLRSSKSPSLVVPIDGDKLLELINSNNRNQTLISFVEKAMFI